jgi:hypothetical protein
MVSEFSLFGVNLLIPLLCRPTPFLCRPYSVTPWWCHSDSMEFREYVTLFTFPWPRWCLVTVWRTQTGFPFSYQMELFILTSLSTAEACAVFRYFFFAPGLPGRKSYLDYPPGKHIRHWCWSSSYMYCFVGCCPELLNKDASWKTASVVSLPWLFYISGII